MPKSSAKPIPSWSGRGRAQPRRTSQPGRESPQRLPNVLARGVIDWQHHGPVPLGYDVYPALGIVAFKVGGKGYSVRPVQRSACTSTLDDTTAGLIGRPVSEHLGDFLFVKCFFFLALMRPTDPARHNKHIKWGGVGADLRLYRENPANQGKLRSVVLTDPQGFPSHCALDVPAEVASGWAGRAAPARPATPPGRVLQFPGTRGRDGGSGHLSSQLSLSP